MRKKKTFKIVQVCGSRTKMIMVKVLRAYLLFLAVATNGQSKCRYLMFRSILIKIQITRNFYSICFILHSKLILYT